MTNPVVNVNVSVLTAPTPNTLQRKGAAISQGATNTSQGAITRLTQLSDLTAIIKGALALSSITWTTNVATATASAPHGLTGTFPVTIVGATPAAYNGTFLATVTGASTFTYPLPSNPGGSASPAGTYTLEDVAELTAMITTFFAQGNGPGISVLELGDGDSSSGTTFLATWLAQNPNTFYAFLVPRYWDGRTSYLSFLANYNATTAKVYFYTTTTLQNYLLYAATLKCCVALIEAYDTGVWPANVITALSQTGGIASATTTTAHGVLPGQWFQMAGNAPAGWNGWFLAQVGTTGSTLVFNVPSSLGAESGFGTLVQSQYAFPAIPATEFSIAAEFWNVINNKPSGTNKVAPVNLGFVVGVTPFPTQGNNSLISTLLAANINLIGTGAAGGISNTLVLGGHTMDGKPINFWYSVDWVQINAALNLTNYLINGANNPTNPVYYNQAGINGGQTVLATTMNTGVTDGLVLNNVKMTTLSAEDLADALNAGTYAAFSLVNADPFASYVQENPNDYGTGTYDGYSIEYVPLRGFESITINIVVSQFAA